MNEYVYNVWIFFVVWNHSMCKFSNASYSDCSSSLGMTSRAIKNHQIKASSSFSEFTKPETARLRNQWVSGQTDFGGWCAEDTDEAPYLQIDFQRETVVRKLATQGLQYPTGNWVIEYAVNYSCDGYRWSVYEEDNKQKVFKGNVDDSSVQRNMLKRPIISRFIRFRPLKHNGVACMRVEMYGCYSTQDTRFSDCSMAVGMEDNRIPNLQITASSHSQSHLPSYGRLNMKQTIVNGSVQWGAWCTSQVQQQQYLQIDLGDVRTVSRLATQGYTTLGWVTNYKMNYSLDERDWYTYKDNTNKSAKIFDGNWDADTVNNQHLEPKISARFVRFLPTAWKTPGSICMRVEVYECLYYKGCPQLETTLKPTGSQAFSTNTPSTTQKPTVSSRGSNKVKEEVTSIGAIFHAGQLILLICFICVCILC